MHFNIINLEDFGCPKLDQLQSIHGTACLAHHLFPEICTNTRVHALREWVVSDFRENQYVSDKLLIENIIV